MSYFQQCLTGENLRDVTSNDLRDVLTLKSYKNKPNKLLFSLIGLLTVIGLPQLRTDFNDRNGDFI